MTIKECYEAVGENYEDVLARLSKEERIVKFSKKFFETGDYELLEKAVKDNNATAIFDYTHKIKGNALNIGFDIFGHLVSDLCEHARGKDFVDVETTTKMFEIIENQYVIMKEIFSKL